VIKLLIVDDSRTARDRIALDVAGASDIILCGTAKDGPEGVRLAVEREPDVILMDLVMPGMDGCEATRAIMTRRPVPVIVMTSADGRDATKRAFESGAAEFFTKGQGAAALLETIRTMARVKVVGFHVHERVATMPERVRSRRASGRSSTPHGVVAPAGIVVVGASTGGPQALQVLLSNLRPDLPIAYVIVLHIAHGFLDSLTGWLKTTAGPTLKVAREGERFAAGVAYFAPDGTHLEITRAGTAALTDAPLRHGLRPAVDVLFESAAQTLGRRSLGLLMTGMGSDGARGLLAMHQAGAMTVTQDEASCVVYGMPKMAVSLGASRAALTPQAAAGAIAVWARQLPKETTPT